MKISHLDKYIGHTSLYALLYYCVEIYLSAVARHTVVVQVEQEYAFILLFVVQVVHLAMFVHQAYSSR